MHLDPLQPSGRIFGMVARDTPTTMTYVVNFGMVARDTPTTMTYVVNLPSGAKRRLRGSRRLPNRANSLNFLAFSCIYMKGKTYGLKFGEFVRGPYEGEQSGER